jgi:hypothetical protein
LNATVFWSAVAAVGTIVATIIAFFQLRHSKQKSDPDLFSLTRSEKTLAASRQNEVAMSTELSTATQQPETEMVVEKMLEYRFSSAIGKIPKDMQRHELEPEVHVTILILKNGTQSVLQDIKLRLSGGWKSWSCNVESTKILAKQAIVLTLEDRSVKIEVEQFPVAEEVSISFFTTGLASPELKSENANVDLRWKHEF